MQHVNPEILRIARSLWSDKALVIYCCMDYSIGQGAPEYTCRRHLRFQPDPGRDICFFNKPIIELPLYTDPSAFVV